MRLSSYPADYSSAFGDNLFCFEDADPTSPVEISFFSDGSTATLLGTKRFLGRSEFAADISNFLRRTLFPAPTFSPISRLVYPAERNVAAYASWGDGYRSATIPFVASTEPIVVPCPIGGEGYQSRRIGRSEYDEVTFSAPADSSVKVRLTFPDGQTLSSGVATGSRGGIWCFVLNVDTLLGMINNGSQQSGVQVVVSVEEEVVVTVDYTFVERGEKAVRLAWLAPCGAIHYHTFPTIVAERWCADRHSVDSSAEGLVTLSAEGWREVELLSGHVSEQEAERLSELLSSPFVWRCMSDGSCEPQHILSGNSTLRGGRGGSLSLTLRPSQTTRTW